MTIGTRLFLALAALALTVGAIAGLGWRQLQEIDRRATMVSEGVRRLEHVASIERDISVMQTIIGGASRGDSISFVRRASEFAAIRADSDGRLRAYADSLVDNESGSPLFSATRTAFRQWATLADRVVSVGESAGRDVATGLARDSLDRLLRPLVTAASQWQTHEETQVVFARRHEADAIEAAKQGSGYAIAVFVLMCLGCGLSLRHQISEPIRRLESGVVMISSGKLALRMPFMSRNDEIGALARSIDALRLTSFALENERWTKVRASHIMAAVQRAPSLEELGAALLSELLPEIGSGAGALSVVDDNNGTLRRVVAYGVAPDAVEPIERIAWRLESAAGTLLGVADLATERFISERERGLITAVMPQVAMALELLQLRRVTSPPRPRLPA
jgi:HAMP domain-containing protein